MSRDGVAIGAFFAALLLWLCLPGALYLLLGFGGWDGGISIRFAE